MKLHPSAPLTKTEPFNKKVCFPLNPLKRPLKKALGFKDTQQKLHFRMLHVASLQPFLVEIGPGPNQPAIPMWHAVS